MKQHKWHKEIKAWADGAEIEFKVGGEGEWMLLKGTPYWECESDLFRIKPHKALNMWHTQIIGKIKLEEDHG